MNMHYPWVKKIRIGFTISCLVFILLTSCEQTNVPVLNNLTCEPPCWKGIYPGETTEEEVALILNSLPEVDQSSISFNGQPRDIFDDVIYFKFKKSELQGWISIFNGKASLIQIFGEGNRNIGITFGEAVNKLGEPKYIINIPTSGGVPLSPTTSYIIIAVQPERGFDFDFDTRDLPAFRKTELRPENTLRVISFFDPEFFDQLIEAGFFSLGRLHASETRKYWIPWDGYGNIAEKYPPVYFGEK